MKGTASALGAAVLRNGRIPDFLRLWPMVALPIAALAAAVQLRPGTELWPSKCETSPREMQSVGYRMVRWLGRKANDAHPPGEAVKIAPNPRRWLCAERRNPLLQGPSAAAAQRRSWRRHLCRTCGAAQTPRPSLSRKRVENDDAITSSWAC